MAINVCTETDDAIANGPYNNGNATEDLTASIQECFDNIDDSRYTDPYIQNGIYLVDELTIPFRAGWRLRGAGAIGETESYDVNKRAQRTVLKYNGAEGGTMLEIRGKYGRISDIAFNGRTTSNDTADEGFFITKAGNTGMATGWHVFERCHFWNFNNYGARNGASVSEANCEEIDLHNCDFYDCGVAAWQNTGAFQMGIRLHGCRLVSGGGSFVRATGGGKMLMADCSVLCANATFLETQYQLQGFGTNNAHFVIDRPIIDNQTGDSFKLIDGNSFDMHVTVNQGVHSMESGGAFTYNGNYVTCKGRSFIHFNNHHANFNGMSGAYQAGYGTPVFTFNGCGSFGGQPKDQISGTYSVRQTNCYNARTGAMYSDYPGGDTYIDGELFNPSNGSIGDIVVE